MDNDKIITGRRIQERRKELKISQEQLAEILDCSKNHLSAIETGKDGLSIEIMKKLCLTLRVTPDFLFLGTLHPDDLSQNLTDAIRLCSEEDKEMLQKIIEIMVHRNGKNIDFELL